MGMPRSSSTRTQPRQAAERDLGVGEAVVEGQAHVIGIAERQRAAHAIDGGVGVVRILEIEQIERWRLPMRRISARPSTLRSRVETTTAALPSKGSPCDDLTSLARTRSCTVASVVAPVEDALAGDAAAAHAELELVERDDVVVDAQVAGQRRDGDQRRGDARDRDEALAG